MRRPCRIAPLLAAVAAALAPHAAPAQPCSVTSTVDAPKWTPITRPGSIGFEVRIAKTGACCEVRPGWFFEDTGTTSGLYSLSHNYSTPGTYGWRHQAYHGCAPNPIGNLATGQVVVVPAACTIDVAASAQVIDAQQRRVRFTAAATATGCGTERPIYYKWSHGDGTDSTWSLSGEDEYVYTTEGNKWWQVRASFGDPKSYVWGDKGGWLAVGCTGRRVGSICFTADWINQVGDTHTLTGNVRANDVLQFVGSPVTLRGDLATGTADLFTDADLRVATAGKLGPVTIFSGAGQYFIVNGNSTPPGLRPQLMPSPAPIKFKLNQIPLYWAPGNPIEVEAQVRVPVLLYVGRADGFHIGILALRLGLRPGVGIELLPAGQILSGGAAGWVTLEEIRDLSYDSAADTVSGRFRLKFPYLHLTEPWEPEYPFEFQASVDDGCIDTLSWVPDPNNVGEYAVTTCQFGCAPMGLKGIALGGLCSPEPLPLFSGWLTLQPNGAMTPNLAVSDSLWVYSPPRTFKLWLGGDATFVGRALSKPGGFVAAASGIAQESLFLAGSFGTGGLPDGGDVLRGTLRLGTLCPASGGIWSAVGTLRGTFTLDASCPCPPNADPAFSCEKVRAALLARPASARTRKDTTFEMWASGLRNDYNSEARFGGQGVFPGLDLLAVGVRVFTDNQGSEPTRCSFGYNLLPAPKPPAAAGALRAAAATQSATFTKAEEPAVFGCTGLTGVTPAIRVSNDAGWVLTPATASSYPGVSYGADEETRTASFLVASAAPGTWTLALDNLGEGEASCSILTVQPPPAVAFTRVEPSGPTVSLELSVDPPAETTKVSLYYSTADDGIPEGEIAAGLPATAGTVAAAWDTSALASGSYFVFARTDDGLNAPITTVHRPAVAVVNGALEPPTGLAATRTSDTATLAWTPSPSAGVVGYTVRYTGDPDAPDYPESAGAALPTGAMVSGLDARSSYRFCVAAYALDGTVSPCSASVVLAPTIRLRRVLPH